MVIKLIMTDHDGVIVDSSEDVYLALWELMTDHSFGRRPPSFLDFLQFFRPPGDEWFARYGFDFPADKIAETLRCAPEKSPMFPTVPSLLARIHELKLPIVVISAGDQSRIEKQLGVGRVLHFFEFVVGESEDKAREIDSLCSVFSINPVEAVYIGDRPSDMESGREAGVTAIGFTDDRPVMEKALIKAGAQHCVKDHHELGELLAQLAS